jgi:HAD superfamily hydrolase (TIGR01493 family)
MPKALIFDVFGTCVDWRTSVAREVASVLPQVDATAFAMAWRAEYDPAMARIRDGGRGYVPLDDLHLENLHRVAEAFGVTAPDSLNTAWERLDPWPDVVPGLARAESAQHHRPLLQRVHRADDAAGEIRGPSLGLHPGRGSWPATTSRNCTSTSPVARRSALPQAR